LTKGNGRKWKKLPLDTGIPNKFARKKKELGEVHGGGQARPMTNTRSVPKRFLERKKTPEAFLPESKERRGSQEKKKIATGFFGLGRSGFRKKRKQGNQQQSLGCLQKNR